LYSAGLSHILISTGKANGPTEGEMANRDYTPAEKENQDRVEKILSEKYEITREKAREIINIAYTEDHAYEIADELRARGNI
jgi:hypothetical protein